MNNDEGKSFFTDVLGNPKFILAPMVDQSELAWRLMARKYGAQVCYSPMYNANVISQNSTYREKVIKDISNPEDRPLIVQFCANTPEQLLNAGRIVEPYCDAIDLNLGCPQHIARRGHFGAFLQDSWPLLSKIISTSQRGLTIPVTAKIRVFPEVQKTVEYAKALEAAGCSLLTVHGRTKDQKGLDTGLASWDHIKAVKEALSIPVVANGNIQTLDDIHRCISETGVDAVMVAESHLTNPCIFAGKNPPVYEMTKEYLALVRRHPCPMSCVRAHLFRLWVHTFKAYPGYRVVLGRASSLDEMEKINEDIHETCQMDDGTSQYCYNEKGVPHWICQPYVRDSTEEKTKSERPQKVLEDENDEDAGLSRNQRRRLQKYRRKVEVLRFKRQSERTRRKEKKAKEKLEYGSQCVALAPNIHSTSNLNKELINARLAGAMNDDSDAIKVCVDLSWTAAMNEKEISKLAGQIGRLYGSNRKSKSPAALYFTGFSKDSMLYRECARKHNGFENYKITVSRSCYSVVFPEEPLVYLSPDAETELEDVSGDFVYILGGLVDETVRCKLTRDHAHESGITACRLPIDSHMHRSGHHNNYSTVLAINQVFDVLLIYNSTKCWKKALAAGMPSRKGYLVNEDEDR